ncbi:MAG: hypothetical protein LBJ09_00370 [Clostridiales bacterium]|jgi:hypothetical protein|nr:hypothetical protein [Clostridiales bacterium]
MAYDTYSKFYKEDRNFEKYFEDATEKEREEIRKKLISLGFKEKSWEFLMKFVYVFKTVRDYNKTNNSKVPEMVLVHKGYNRYETYDVFTIEQIEKIINIFHCYDKTSLRFALANKKLFFPEEFSINDFHYPFEMQLIDPANDAEKRLKLIDELCDCVDDLNGESACLEYLKDKMLYTYGYIRNVCLLILLAKIDKLKKDKPNFIENRSLILKVKMFLKCENFNDLNTLNKQNFDLLIEHFKQHAGEKDKLSELTKKMDEYFDVCNISCYFNSLTFLVSKIYILLIYIQEYFFSTTSENFNERFHEALRDIPEDRRKDYEEIKKLMDSRNELCKKGVSPQSFDALPLRTIGI